MSSQNIHPSTSSYDDDHMSGVVHAAVPSEANPGTEVDSNDNDSVIDMLGYPRSTQSVRTSVYDFVEENWRTYHNFHSGKYMVPNDALEQDRLELQNHIWLLTLDGKLHFTPFSTPPQRVLDIGCDTGSWAIEFAHRYPSAHVTGVDLSPIQPEYVPPNCDFEIDDIEEEWLFTEPFDFIHGRALMTCFKDSSVVFASAFKALAPGGYFEMQDGCMPFRSADGTLENTTVLDWCQKALEGSARLGRRWADPRGYKAIMEAVGFVDIMETRLKWPLNTWPKDKKLKDLGMWVPDDMMEILPAVKKVFIAGLGWSVEDADAFVERAKVDIMDRSIHGWIDIVIIYGRKPDIS